MRAHALSTFFVILRSSFFSFGSVLSLVTAARKPIRLAARRRARGAWLAADRTRWPHFLSLASAVAKSVALAALSFSACDFVRLNTRSPFIGFFIRYLLSVRPNAQAFVHG